MERLAKTRVSLELLLAEATTLSYSVDDGYVGMAVAQSGGLPAQVMALPGIRAAVAEISGIRQLAPISVMVNWLEPGAPVPRHRDWLLPTPLQRAMPRLERWHLPVAANEECRWWDERGGWFQMPEGVWCGPAPYWLMHTVENGGASRRIHLVVDLDTPVPVGRYAEEGDPC